MTNIDLTRHDEMNHGPAMASSATTKEVSESVQSVQPAAEAVQPAPAPPTPRRTRQRQLIANLLAGSDQLLTAQQIHRRLDEQGEAVGLATVYRTLTAMAESGEIDALRTGTEWGYRHCSPTHHHHLVCRGCGRTIEISAPPLEEWAATTAAAYGYSGVEHVIEISGLCPVCQAAERPSQTPRNQAPRATS